MCGNLNRDADVAANLEGILAVQKLFKGKPSVAVFDTGELTLLLTEFKTQKYPKITNLNIVKIKP